MKLKMRYSLPVHLEQKLRNKYGWAVESQKYNEHITFVKIPKNQPALIIPSVKPTIRVKAGTTSSTLVFSPGITEKEKTALTERCDRIIDNFQDPYSAVMGVRQRLINLSSSLPLAQKQFVLDFMEEEFPESLAWDKTVKQKGMAGS
jgi:hypothetical protein